MLEQWKTIQDFPNYSVSTHGRVKGPRKSILKPVDGGQGYLKVTLTKDGKHIDKRINRLVAQSFLSNDDNLPLVMHLDNNRQNNHVSNLKWGTHAENNQWMYDCDRHPITLTDAGREKACAKRRTPIKAIDIRSGKCLYFDGQHDAARALNVTQQHIWGVCNGYRKSTGGYKFEYVKGGDEDERY